MKYSPKNHVWAVIQSGQCVFGTGRTREAAIADAAKCMEVAIYDESGEPIGNKKQGQATVAEVEAQLVRRSDVVDGDVYITNDAEDIRSYVENQ